MRSRFNRFLGGPNTCLLGRQIQQPLVPKVCQELRFKFRIEEWYQSLIINGFIKRKPRWAGGPRQSSSSGESRDGNQIQNIVDRIAASSSRSVPVVQADAPQIVNDNSILFLLRAKSKEPELVADLTGPHHGKLKIWSSQLGEV